MTSVHGQSQKNWDRTLTAGERGMLTHSGLVLLSALQSIQPYMAVLLESILSPAGPALLEDHFLIEKMQQVSTDSTRGAVCNASSDICFIGHDLASHKEA